LHPQISKTSTRLLTTQREKVKVLAVLYDGGKHAEQVRHHLGFAPIFHTSIRAAGKPNETLR
jgi:hypothetical protein